MNRFFTLLILLVFCAGPARTQNLKQFVFTHYDSRTGSPSNRINDIEQDEKGYIWMATLEGLVRFDGVRYKVFRQRKGQPNSVPFSSVEQIEIDGKNRLWIYASNSQIGIFDTKTFRFYPARIELEDTTLNYFPKGILMGDGGRHVFLGVGRKEILVWNESDNTFKPATDFFPRKPEWHISYFTQQHNTEKYWAVMTDGTVAVYNRATGVMSYTGHNVERDSVLEILSNLPNFGSFYFDKKNRIWVISWEQSAPAVYGYDLNTYQPIVEHDNFMQELKSYHEIWGFYEQSDGTMWLKGMPVLAYFDENKKHFTLLPSGFKPNEEIDYTLVLGLTEDREHNMWVGTETNGFYQFNPSKANFTNLSYPSKYSGKISNFSPCAFLHDKDGSLLISVWGEGLYRYDRNLNRLPVGIKGYPESSTTATWDMCPDLDGIHAWFSCQPGIFYYNMQKKEGYFINPPIFENRTIRQVEMDPKGNLWFGTQGLGLIKWDRNKWGDDQKNGIFKVEKATINSPVNNITVDKKGWVWVATGGNGLFVFDSNTDELLMHFNDKSTGYENIPDHGVSAVLEYNDSLMVITTSTQVLLFNRNQRKVSEIYGDDDIPGFIASLQKDKEGNVWMGTTTNLIRFNPWNKTLVSFSREDGIFNDQFVLSATIQLEDGTMVFGTGNQVLFFNPDKLKSKPELPNIAVTDIKTKKNVWLLDTLPSIPELELEPGDNSLTIYFTPLTYNSWYAVQYKMEGLDKDWNVANKNYEAVYSYLPPGTYRFLCRAVDSEMNVSPEQVQFTVQVLPHFYQSWWFYGLLVLLLGTLLFWFDHERMNRKAAIAEVRNKIADDLHKEVNITLQNINILSEMANMKADTDAHKSKEFIAQIHQKSHNMIEAMDDMLWGLSTENDSMGKTVLRMEEYIGKLNSRYNAQIEMLIDDNVRLLPLNMEIRYEVFLLFKEGAQGMMHACPEGYKIHVSLDKKSLLYTVYCDNNRFNELALNNLIQRPDLIRRVQAIHADWDLNMEKTGFVFELSIPVIQ